MNPLPLTPFEEYMLLDSHPAYPMSCFILLRTRGTLRQDVFRESLHRTLERHPFLRSGVEQTGRNRYVWKPMPFQDGRQQTADDGNFVEQSSTIPTAVCRLPSAVCCGIDLFREPALKITYRTDQENAGCMQFEIHHSACDAAGAFGFIEDLMTDYGVAAGVLPADTPRKEIDPSLLERRGKYGLTPRKWLRILPQQLWGLTRAWMFLMNRVLPLVPFTPNLSQSKPPQNFPAIISKEFDENETLAIRNIAKKNEMTLNDLLLYATFAAMQIMFLTMKKFSNDGKKGYLRIAVPTNLRTDDVQNISAANIVSMVFLDRKPEKIRLDTDFRRGIHREMAHIKRCNLGLAFIHGLTIYKKLFGDYRKMIDRGRCWTTGTVSNLGVLLAGTPANNQYRAGTPASPGEFEIIGVEAVPPIRPWSVFGLCASTFQNRLTLTLQYDTTAMTQETAECFLNTLAAHCHIPQINIHDGHIKHVHPAR